jgi:uncharacterized protein YgiM (DUF1202 family)
LILKSKQLLDKSSKPVLAFKIIFILFLLITFSSYLDGSLLLHLEKVESFTGIKFSSDVLKKEPEKLEEDEISQYYTLNVKAGNVRKDPSLSGKVLFVVNNGEKLKYLGNESTDNEGRVWYFIETEKEKKGWICRSIIKLLENNN